MPNDQIQEWFDANRDVLENYAEECSADPAAALKHVITNLRQCRSTSRDKFVLWAAKQIASLPGFGGSFDAIRGLNLDVLGLFNKAEQDYEFKPFNTVETPTTVLIDMGKSMIWKVPTTETVTIRGEHHTWAEVAERLWPCTLRKIGGAFQVAKKIRGVYVHIARVFLGAQDDQMVKFQNGDPLDYTGANPYIVSDTDAPKSTAESQARFERATLTRTHWDMDNVSIVVDEEGQKLKWQAKPTPELPTLSTTLEDLSHLGKRAQIPYAENSVKSGVKSAKE